MFMLPLPSSHRAVRDDIDKGSKGDNDKPPKPPKKKVKKARAEKACPDELKYKYKMNYNSWPYLLGLQHEGWLFANLLRSRMGSLTNATKDIMCVQIVTSRGTVQRHADQQTIDSLVKQPQGTLQLRLQRQISLR